MSDKVDYNHLRNIIKDAPGFTLGECNGILSKDDSYVNDFKLKVIPFCIENEKYDYNAVEKIVTTADYDSVKKVIENLQDYDECNKFAKAFVDEVTVKIEGKKWYHQIVIMQCAIIDAIHTIFKKYDEPLTSCVDNEIILGLATKFDAWFDNLKKSNTKAIKLANTKTSNIDTTVKNFSERLRLGKGVYDESNDQRFEEFLKSFETDYMNTDDYNWIDTCTQGLASTGDIKTLKTQLTNLKKAIQDKNWLAASSAMLTAQLSITLEKIFEVGNNSKDAVRHSVTAVIEQQQKKQQQKLLQNFLNKLDISCLPFNAYAWWEYFVESTSFDESLDNPLWDFMQCVTGKIDGNIPRKIKELSDALCKAFAVKDTGSITTTLNKIVQRMTDMQKSLKEKYGTDIVDNLLKVIDCVDAQGYVDLSSEPSWELVDKELHGFKDLLETEDKWQCVINVIHEVLQGINEQLDPETLAESATDLLVNSGVINTDEKGPAVEKIKGKIEELQNKRTKKSTTPVNTNFAPTPTIVENDTKQLQQKSSLLTPEPKPPKTISQKHKITANTNTLPKLSEKSADFKVTTSQNKTQNLKEITINSYTQNDTGQLIKTEQNAQIPSVLADHWTTCKKNLSNNNQPLTGGSCVICNRIVRIVRYLQNNQTSEAISLIGTLKNTNNNSPTDINSTLDMWIRQIETNTVTFSNHARKFMSFAERAVSKQARKKHTKQIKNNNAEVSVDDVIDNLPCQINNLKESTLNTIKTILRNTSSDLISLDSNNTNTLCNDNVSAKTIETIAKPLRNTAKKTHARPNANIDSNSVVALAVLYKVLTAAIDFKGSADEQTENTAQLNKLFTAFAEWFNKYVSPRSAIRSPKVVEALNNTVGKMAGNTNAFKCGKLTRAKNAAKEIAKKISTKSDASVDTNSGSAGHKERKREKLKSNLKKLSPRKLISRKKKQETNKEA